MNIHDVGGRDLTVDDLMKMDVVTLHNVIISKAAEHADIESAIHKRIAAIPRLPITETRDGRWWHFANAHAYPFGN